MSDVKVANLANSVRFAARLLRTMLKLISARNYDKMTEAERAAVEGIIAALQILLVLLPAPGEDDNPATST